MGWFLHFESHHPTHMERCGEMFPQQGRRNHQHAGQLSCKLYSVPPTQEAADTNRHDGGQEEDKGPLVVIPYVVEGIRRVCRKLNMRVVNKSRRTLCSRHIPLSCSQKHTALGLNGIPSVSQTYLLHNHRQHKAKQYGLTGRITLAKLRSLHAAANQSLWTVAIFLRIIAYLHILPCHV